MSRRTAGVAAALAVATAIAIPTLAGARGGGGDCHVDITARLASVKKINGNPPASGSDVSAGILDGTICGEPFHGAVRNVNNYPSLGPFTFRNRSFGGVGAFKTIGSGRGTPNPDGSVSLAGSGHISGGTGIYREATGSVSFTGTVPKGSTVATLHTTGDIDY